VGKSFLDLIVWQRAVDMTVSVYELTDSFPRKEIYGLTSQLRRAAVSVASNIAEGAGRGSKKEFRQFLNVARGSNCEVQTQLMIASRLNLTAHQDLEMAESLSHEVGRMLNGLLQSLLPDGERPGTEN
jgi:four helix bundle protein